MGCPLLFSPRSMIFCCDGTLASRMKGSGRKRAVAREVRRSGGGWWLLDAWWRGACDADLTVCVTRQRSSRPNLLINGTPRLVHASDPRLWQASRPTTSLWMSLLRWRRRRLRPRPRPRRLSRRLMCRGSEAGRRGFYGGLTARAECADGGACWSGRRALREDDTLVQVGLWFGR